MTTELYAMVVIGLTVVGLIVQGLHIEVKSKG